MKLIVESNWDVVIYEDKKSDSLKIAGIFSSAEIENQNKRKYPKEILEREIEKINDKVSNKCLFGELSHPNVPDINPERISHIIEKLEWKNNDVYGKAKILSTPFGEIAKTLIKEGKVGISSRGLGTVNESGFVNEDFNLITWDIVLDASNPGSRFVNGIYEDKEFNIKNDEKQIDEMVNYYQSFIFKGFSKEKIYNMYKDGLVRWPL